MKCSNNKRGYKICRCCGSEQLFDVLNLGSQPLPTEYGATPSDVMEVFPLELRICKLCGLGQLAEYVLPERIFHSSYPYFSSASSTMRNHARWYSVAMKDVLQLDEKTLVLEIASNDGYLLREFANLGVKVLGVEPASNVARQAQSLGIDTIVNFFGENTAKDLCLQGFQPRLIVANNVFAHVPDMQDFMAGLSVLCDDKTIITIENPSLVTLFQNTLFDTIYHEHYSYLTAHSISLIAKMNGLTVNRVEKIKTHGGSNRYWLSRGGQVDASVHDVLTQEKKAGLFDGAVWKSFAKRTEKIIQVTRDWLLASEAKGDTIVGYGAAHKGNTFLNSIGLASRVLKYVVDASLEKHGRFLPGSQIPVLDTVELNRCHPSDVWILPWNLADEIKVRINHLAPNARIWIAQPNLKQIT